MLAAAACAWVLAVMGSNLVPEARLAFGSGVTQMWPREELADSNLIVGEFFCRPFTMPDSKDLGWFD